MASPPTLESGEPVFEMQSPSLRSRCLDRVTCGSAGGRDYFDWSYIFLGGGCGTSLLGVGATCLVPNLEIRLYLAAFTVLDIGLTTALACLRVCCMKPWVRQGKVAVKYGRENERLRGENSKLSQHAASLKDTATSIQKACDDAKESVKGLEKALKDSVTDLGAAALLQTQTVERLKAVQDLLDQYREKARAMAKETNRFNRTQGVFQKNVGEFSGEVEKLKVHKADLFKNVEDFDDIKDFMDQQTDQLDKIYGGFEANNSLVQDSVQGLSDELKEFRENNHKIDLEGEELKDTVADLKEVEGALEDALAKALEEQRKLQDGGSK